MAFKFSSSAYNFPARWTAAQRQHAEQILTYTVKYGGRPADVMRMFANAGISYRKTNMLSDISRASAIEQAKSAGAYRRAEAWYNTLEKVRQNMPNKTRQEALDFMGSWKTETWDSAEAAELANSIELEGGCPSPPC